MYKLYTLGSITVYTDHAVKYDDVTALHLFQKLFMLTAPCGLSSGVITR